MEIKIHGGSSINRREHANKQKHNCKTKKLKKGVSQKGRRENGQESP